MFPVSGLQLVPLLAVVPLAWLVWSRGGLPGPCHRFPRDPLSLGLAAMPRWECWWIALGALCLVGVLAFPEPPTSPPSTLFLIDTSASMADPTVDSQARITTKLKRGTDFLKNWVESGVGPTERWALVRFSTMPRVMQPLTEDRAAIVSAIEALEPEATPLDAETNLVDGLIEALVRINAVPASRRVLVVWTDGEANVRANASGWSLTQVAMAIRALGVGLVIADAGPPELDPSDPGFARREEAKSLLKRLASESDGVLLDRLEAIEEFAPNARKETSNAFPWPRQLLRGGLAIIGTLLLALGGCLFLRRTWWTRGGGQVSAMDRRRAWAPGESGAWRRWSALLAGSVLMAASGAAWLVFDWANQGQALALLFDVRPSMLAGQPSRIESARRFLERGREFPGGADQPRGPWEYWIMGAQPHRVFAATWDAAAIADEWERLEVYAEEPAWFEDPAPQGDPPRFPGSRVLWISDGVFAPPTNLARAWDIAVLDATTPGNDRLERQGERYVFPAQPDRLAGGAWWYHSFRLSQPPEELAGWMGRFPQWGAQPGRLWILGALGFLVVSMVPGVARVTAPGTGPLVITQGLRKTAGLVLMLGLGGLAAQEPDLSSAAMSGLRRAGTLLDSLETTSPADRGKILDQASRALDDALAAGAGPTLEYRTLRFLISAHQRDLQKRKSPPPSGAGSDPERRSPQNEAKPPPTNDPGKKSPELDDPAKGPETPSTNERGPDQLIAPGDPLTPGAGLFDRLLQAQRKIARESTTRRLSRIVPREWGPMPTKENR